MNFSYAVYSLAIAWFTYTAFRMSVLLYQFLTFPKTYGSMPRFSLRELLEAGRAVEKDLPIFRVVVPAYRETEVIEGTIRRLAKLNYPLTHFQVYITTYDDEETAEADSESTTEVVQRVAQELNEELGTRLVRSVVVPASYDGYFPGNLSAQERHIGKSRGLNFTLRSIHEENERDERQYFIGKMIQAGHFERTARIIAELLALKGDPEAHIRNYFTEKSQDYIGALVLSSQLHVLLELFNRLIEQKDQTQEAIQLLENYLQSEASRFYYKVQVVTDISSKSRPKLKLQKMDDKEFLFDVMMQVEQTKKERLLKIALRREQDFELERPFLYAEIAQARNGEALFQAARKLNSRWMMVYDADADAPVDLMRYLAGRILDESSIMGYQGPVAPVLNYEEVHPLCKLGGLWMAFWHAAKYPRLMTRPEWAHPLAGTNWCFHIEGMEQDGTLIRDCPYDECKRHFLLSFDPKQLTEDLEAGIRFYSDWSINAEWHPVLEMEQVPPTPKALVVQRTRWTLGTLQTIGYITRSKIPFLQKIRFVLHPAEIMINGSGPVIAIFLFVALFTGFIIVEPVFMWWAILLTFANFIYIYCFQKVFERYYDIRQRARTMDYIYQHRKDLMSMSSLGLNIDKNILNQIIILLKNSLKRKGFAFIYYNNRCLDDDEKMKQGDSVFDYLLKNSPTRIHRADLSELLARLEYLKAQIQGGERIKNGKEQLSLLQTTHNVLQAQQKLDQSQGLFRWSKFHKEIFIWTFPYIFYQLGPYFKGLYKWLRGGESAWHKTTRTPKRKSGNIS